jgi:membrane protease YdiL (CAAX protease family)
MTGCGGDAVARKGTELVDSDPRREEGRGADARFVPLPGAMPAPGPGAASGPPVETPAAPGGGPRREPRLGDLAVAVTLYVALLFVVVLATGGAYEDAATLEPPEFFWLQLLDDGILAAVALLFGCLRFPGSLRGLGFRPVSWRWWALGVTGGAVGAAAAWGLAAALAAWGWPPPSHPVGTIAAGARSLADLLLVLVTVSVVVPLGEETFFRGFAYQLLRARLGVAPAVLGTALLFALVHGLDVGAWVPLLPIGVLFALLVERSGSLVPAVAAHGMVNALAVLAG